MGVVEPSHSDCPDSGFSDPADARQPPRQARRHATSSYSPGYAAIVVDANTGSVLHSANADAIRHPASLTKIMTLYMLFERLESGKLSLDSQLRVSEHAADQSPTKLGLREGSTISVEDAIKGMVTRSANDAAVVVAENLAGSEEEFARQMTRKARALGMSNTTYRNASGLPDSAQVTTARDQATLGRAIQERFPRYYRYFSTRTFTFRGQRIGNHNRLLGKVEGVDGIKTGYIRASGFNLVTSVKRDGRHVVAVVLGGTSAGARDARMRQLLAQHVGSASTRRTAPMIAEAPVRDTPAPRTARASHGRATETLRRRSLRDGERQQHTDAVRSAARRGPAAGAGRRLCRADPAGRGPHRFREARSEGPPRPRQQLRSPSRRLPLPLPAPRPRRPPPARAGFLGVLPARTASVSEPPPAPVRTEPVRDAAPQRETPPQREAALQRETAPPAPAAPSSRPQTRSGWVIQVGAYPAESEAHQRLALVEEQGVAPAGVGRAPSPRRCSAAKPPSIAPVLPGSSANRPKPPANSSSATTSIAWR